MRAHLAVFLLCCLILHATRDSPPQVAANDGFITVNGTQFMLNGSPFYANGFNAYWLMHFGADSSLREKVSQLFRDSKTLRLKMARTWAFSDGTEGNLQRLPGSYDETMFKGLDFVVSEAGKYGIKLILSLVNNYDEYGGKKQYVNWARNQGQSIASDDDFFTNPVIKGFYKNHIRAVLTRRNTLTGVTYKDDPTILAWELMNEPRCKSDTSGKIIQAWIQEMAKYVKSIDPKHLLQVGLEGFYGLSDPEKQQYNPNFQVGTDFIANNQVPEIDFTTVHCYPDQWLQNTDDKTQLEFLSQWVTHHIQDSQTVLKKPVIVAEFGKSTKTSTPAQRDQLFSTVYDPILTSARAGGAAAGGMFWQLFVAGMDSYKDGYEVILGESSKSTTDLILTNSKKLNRIRKGFANVGKQPGGGQKA